jgi:hypothetical protein
MAALGECQEFAGSMLGAFENAFANESLTQKIAKVVLHLVMLATVSVVGEVGSGDDAELAKVNERADFGVAETVTAITVVNETARFFKMNGGAEWYGRIPGLWRWPLRSHVVTALALRSLVIGLVFALGLDGIEKILPFANWVEARHV